MKMKSLVLYAATALAFAIASCDNPKNTTSTSPNTGSDTSQMQQQDTTRTDSTRQL
jgi:hypothetical protein